MEIKDITGNQEVYLVFVNKVGDAPFDRATWYQADGKMLVTIDESTTLVNFLADTNTKLKGFSDFPNLTSDPYVGRNPPVEPSKPLPDRPIDNNWVRLHTLPCADEYSEVLLRDWSLKEKDDANKAEWQLLLFSLTYVESLIKKGILSTCNYIIKDDRGNEWVKVNQYKGAIAGQFGGDCGNNHPRKVDIPSLKEDCIIYLPKDRGYYVEIYNTGEAPIQAWVHHPSGQDRNIYKEKLDGGYSVRVYVSQSEFSGQPWENSIKINGNCVNEVV